MIPTLLPIIVALAVSWVFHSSDTTTPLRGRCHQPSTKATMKLRCSRPQMLAALQLVHTAVGGHDTRPALHNVKAIATDDRCSLMATDLEMGVQRDLVGIPVDEPGEALLPAGRTLAIFREAPDEELMVESGSKGTTVRGGTTEFDLGSSEPSTFPEFPSVNDDGCHEISGGNLKVMIRRTLFAVGTESHRYSLTGVLWELQKSTLRLVATDGRRLAVSEGLARVHGEHNPKGAHVVPTKAMQLLDKNLHDPGEMVRVTLRQNEVLFRTGQATIYSRLVEGRFPAYKDVLPRKASIKVPMVAGPFHSAIRQAAVMTDQDTKRVHFSFKPNTVVLQAQSPEAGRSRIELAIDYSGKPIEIAFHPKNLTDLLRTLDTSDELTLSMTDGKSPALFQIGDNYSYLVVPLI